MHIFHFSLIIGAMWLLLLATGCDTSLLLNSANTTNGTPNIPGESSLPPAIVPSGMAEVFDATSVPGVGKVTIETDLPAEITVIAFPDTKIGLDYTRGGHGASEQLAAVDAHQNITVAVTPDPTNVLIWARLLVSATNSNDYVRLHVRVPVETALIVKATGAANVTVLGKVGDVDISTPRGAIVVSGVTGAVNLITGDGAITVDALAQNPPTATQHLKAQAHNGNINLMGAVTNVMATTTSGSIRFTGSLSGGNNSFITTGNGQVQMALADDLTYHFEVTSHRRVVADVKPGALVCAMATSRDTRMGTEPSLDGIGQIEASDSVVSETYKFTGVMGEYQPTNQAKRPYLYFEDNHSQVTRYIPKSDTPPDGSNAARAFWPDDCNAIDQLFKKNEPQTASLSIATEAGEVQLRLIHKQ